METTSFVVKNEALLDPFDYQAQFDVAFQQFVLEYTSPKRHLQEFFHLEEGRLCCSFNLIW